MRVDGRADQYAVGVTLREMLTGASPADGEATAELRRCAVAAAEDAARRAGASRRSSSRVRARAPDLRYPDCADFAAALELYASERGLVATPGQVERWMREHLRGADRAMGAEARRASERELSLQAATPTVTVSREATAAPRRRPVIVWRSEADAARPERDHGRDAVGGERAATRGARRCRTGRCALMAATASRGGRGRWGDRVAVDAARRHDERRRGDPRVALAVTAGSGATRGSRRAVDHVLRRALFAAPARSSRSSRATAAGARTIELAA